MKKFKETVLFSIMVAILGQIYFYPFHMQFKFSLGVIVLGFVLVYFDDINPILMSVTSGIFIVIFRILPNLFTITFNQAFLLEFPSFFYYLVFGILFYLINLRKRVKENFFYLLFLIMIDSFSNIAEIIVRINSYKEIKVIILAIILVAILRTTIVAIILYFINQSKKKTRKEKFYELILVNAGLNSELFYLKKSSHALEHIMEISYSLYENLEDGKDKEKALNLSKNIHEIKKDYRRVIEGINYNIKKTSEYKLTFKQLISIVEKNSKKMIFNLEKDIDLKFFIQKDFVIKNYYSFLTIINNLIINSIESIEEEGIISLNQKMTKDYLYIEVKDNGPGILKKDLEVIFNSGFTTKYDKETGKMSSGIGLNHVRNIVNNVFNGEIKVDSVVDEYTLFTVKIPRDNLGG